MPPAYNPMPDAYVAFGANLGEPRSNILEALEKLGEIFLIRKISSLYRTRPVGGPTGQPDFINGVVKIAATGSPPDTMEQLLKIEREMGRKREEKWGPRIIDLDLLDQDGVIMSEPELTLPHPLLHERSFVLVPLAEVAPDWRHPVLGLSARELLARLSEEDRAVVVGAPEAPPTRPAEKRGGAVRAASKKKVPR